MSKFLFSCGNSSGIKELYFQRLAATEFAASKSGQSSFGQAEMKIDGLGLKKITFDVTGEGFYGSQLNNAILYGSKNEDRSSYETLWSILRQNATNQEVDISEYKWLRFYVSFTAGAYSSGGEFKNVTLSTN